MTDSKDKNFSPQDVSSSVSKGEEDGEAKDGFSPHTKEARDRKADSAVLPDDQLQSARDLALAEAKKRIPAEFESNQARTTDLVSQFTKLTAPPDQASATTKPNDDV